jgi:hypothetical protein
MSDYRLTRTDARILRSDLRRQERAWKLGFDRGRKVRREVFYASLVGAAWLLLRNPHKHVMLRALVFYGLLALLMAVVVLSPLLFVLLLVRLSRPARRRLHWPHRDKGQLDAVVF